MKAGKPLTGTTASLGYQSQQQFQAGSDVRLAIIAKDERDLQSKLKAAAKQIQAEPERPLVPHRYPLWPGHESGWNRILVSGQGSQYIDMGGQLATSWW